MIQRLRSGKTVAGRGGFRLEDLRNISARNAEADIPNLGVLSNETAYDL